MPLGTGQDHGNHKQCYYHNEQQNFLVDLRIYSNRNCRNNRDNCNGDIINMAHRQSIKFDSFYTIYKGYR